MLFAAACGLADEPVYLAELVAVHQPWWAAKAHLHARNGEPAAAVRAYESAPPLTCEPALRRFPERRLRAARG